MENNFFYKQRRYSVSCGSQKRTEARSGLVSHLDDSHLFPLPSHVLFKSK